MSELNTLNSNLDGTTDTRGKNICESNEKPLQAISEPSEGISKRAVEKLEKEKADAGDKNFADPIINYLIERCEEDSGLAEDVLQEHKTWKKCFNYILGKARKLARGNCAYVENEVVYEWAEDYYHKDDKAEEEKKAKEAEERKKKAVEQKKEDVERKKEDPKKEAGSATKKEKQEVQEKPKPKKKPNELEGQMDLFSMMGL